MKNLFATILFVIAVAVATAQTVDTFNDTAGTTVPAQSGVQDVFIDEPLVPPKAAAPAQVPGDYFTRDQVEAHMRAGHKPAAVNNYYTKNYRSARRTPTAPKGAKAMPNVTIHNHIPANSGSVAAASAKNPNLQGVSVFDPNKIPSGDGTYTVSIGADGATYMSASSGTGFNPWWLLGILALVGLILGIIAMARGNGGGGGGGNHYYHNYPAQPALQPAPAQPQPAPAQNEGGPAPAAPFAPPAAGGGGAAVNQPQPAPGWAQQAVYLVAWPTGGPAQDPSPAQPVVVNINNNPAPAAAAPAQQQPRRQRGGADPAPDPTPTPAAGA